MADDALDPRSWSTEEELRMVLRMLAHEIRNPLACLQAGVQVMQRLGASDGDTSEQLATLLNHIGRIDKITQGIHQIARLVPGDPRPVPIAPVVEQVFQEYRFFAAQAGVELVVGGGPAAQVWSVPSNLCTAFAELVSNAIKASPVDTAVTLRWELGEDGWSSLDVDDQGSGVPPENADKILLPFFSTQPNGRGLGLSVALRACHLAGSRLVWRNRVEGGCRFSVLAPTYAGGRP
ncbi:MAG: HAMP domain-containing histidine kinase [Thermoanaerobaculaceae bacterium]|nr:HAMP domain-containing histidine kinase [Thermoanaerobaculaceae bacterium]MDI9621385.1 HAMP domain-containing sensor histidine kinase [Acidobacteriota bacterium]NLH11625.1 HAMP domain-containing histidine kinase [Holophagae bacterium]HPW56915.1 HAMP domain-containing sensor histidine kinase [Thermoanaerobaculaceae bacterium]